MGRAGRPGSVVPKHIRRVIIADCEGWCWWGGGGLRSSSGRRRRRCGASNSRQATVAAARGSLFGADRRGLGQLWAQSRWHRRASVPARRRRDRRRPRVAAKVAAALHTPPSLGVGGSLRRTASVRYARHLIRVPALNAWRRSRAHPGPYLPSRRNRCGGMLSGCTGRDRRGIICGRV